MLLRTACVFLACAGLALAADSKPVVEIKPKAINLHSCPQADTPQSCVIRCANGPMQILTAESSDARLKVTTREEVPGEIFVVTALLPAGYSTTADRPASITVTTDLADSSRLRIPVHVYGGRMETDLGWLLKARSWVGRPWPEVELPRLDQQSKIKIAASAEHVTAVVFSAHWCGHCDVHVPTIERVWKDYANHGVRFVGVAAGAGNGKGITEKVDNWGVDWPVGVDWGLTLAQRFGVRAYPVVFLVGRNGTIESVHGRENNKDTGNGLDHIEIQLRTELDLLLAGHTREAFPDWEKVFKPHAASQPAAEIGRAELARPKPATQPSTEVQAEDSGRS